MARYVMVLRRATSLRGALDGLGPENRDFFGPKMSSNDVARLKTSNVNDIETTGQTFRYRSLLSEWKQNVLVWSAYYRNESKTYWFVPKNFFFASRTFPFCSKNSGTKQSNLIWSGNSLRQSRTFLFNPKTNRSKQKVFIWSAYYRN